MGVLVYFAPKINFAILTWGMQCSGVEWNGSMECNAVEWNGMDRWNAMQWSGMEWIDGMQCSGVEWNGVDGCSGWMIRTPNVHDKFDFGFFGQSENFHFSKVAVFFSFCEARSKMVSKKRRAPM